MGKGLENLAAMEYPGRVVIIGKDKTGENFIVVYAITGRSSSSQARKLVADKGAVWTKPTEENAFKNGHRNLLVYPAIYVSQGIAVSNGKQTDDIKEHLTQSKYASEVLLSSLKDWDYEPDAPNFTPRISGCILPSNDASLSIIKRALDGSSLRYIFEIPLIEGKGKMMSTYQGENKEPLPAFCGEPLDVEFEGQRAKEVAEEIYQALAPKFQGEDYRVAVACVFSKNLMKDELDVYIINRHEDSQAL